MEPTSSKAQKQKKKEQKKLVEVPPELLEEVVLNAAPEAPLMPVSQSQELPSETNLTDVPISHSQQDVQTSVSAPITLTSLKDYLVKGSLFTLISLVLFGLPYFMAPSVLFPSLEYSYVRTALLMLLIWNLIGAALFAQARTRLAKAIAVVLFGSPLALGVWLVAFVCFLATFAHGKYQGF